MKFRLVAEPNMDTFTSDIRLRTFIQEITALTVSIVTKQCTEEIDIRIKELVEVLTSSMKFRIELIVETIIKQIATVCLEDTITACRNLEGITEKICFPRHSDGHGKCCDSDKHKHHHDKHRPCSCASGDDDLHKHHEQKHHEHKHHEAYDESKHHHSHGEPEKHKRGDQKPDTPNKKNTGKLTPLPEVK